MVHTLVNLLMKEIARPGLPFYLYAEQQVVVDLPNYIRRTGANLSGDTCFGFSNRVVTSLPLVSLAVALGSSTASVQLAFSTAAGLWDNCFVDDGWALASAMVAGALASSTAAGRLGLQRRLGHLRLGGCVFNGGRGTCFVDGQRMARRLGRVEQKVQMRG